jgi:carboxyl-terminal processing protease
LNKKISIGITIGLMALTAAVTFIITYNFSLNIFNQKVKSVTEKEGFYTKLSELDKYVRANYKPEINEDTLLTGIIKGYIAGLDDKYAAYYTKKEYEAMQSKNTGISVGLGFTWDKEESGYINIVSVTENSSADQAGLAPGDVITAVNNTDVIAYEGGYDEAVSLLSCDAGTKVKLHIKRISPEGIAEFFSVDVVSSTTEIISVTSKVIGSTGYIKITAFNAKTPEQFRKNLTDVIAQGVTSLVFDIRDNSEGSTEYLGDVLNCLLGEGDIVTADYKNKSEVVIKTTEAEQIKLPMVVIVNNNTVGNAELFAFALRDNANAQIVGTTTYGKGVMQEAHQLADGSAVMITVAVLKTADSGDFNGVGLKPDFEVSPPADIDLSKLSEEERDDKDSQLIKALEVAETIQ